MSKSRINELMVKVQMQDDAAFEALFNECKRPVFSFIYTYVKNYHSAEDLLQDTFIKIKMNAQSYKAGTNAMAWILETAKNTAIDYLRKENRVKRADIEEANLKGSEPDFNDSLIVHDLLNKYVNDEDRQIVLLHLVYGYKNREIAKILDMPLGTVLWRYNTALKTLKKALKEVGYEK